MKLVDVRKSSLTNNVLHGGNDAIICYCETEEEANRFITSWEVLRRSVE